MAATNFVDKVTTIATAWLNEVDALVHDVFNALSIAGADGTILVSDGTKYVEESGATARASLAIAPIGIPENISLSPSVAASALTMAVKGEDGNDPSATNVVSIRVPNGTGGVNRRIITSALSLVISSGSTLGHNSALKQYIYWYLIDNAGVLELAASSKFFGWHGTVTTTAEGGAGAADSGTTMYSTTARASVPFVCIAYSEDTQTTAGTWATNLSAVRIVPFTHPVISFSADKNGTDQTTITTGAFTKITFGTEIYDNGALFDSVTNNRWIPPPGSVHITAAIAYSTAVDGAIFQIMIRKNGSDFKVGDRNEAAGTDNIQCYTSIEDESNGTDYYEVFAYHEAGSDRTVMGSTFYSYFIGSWSPGRS